MVALPLREAQGGAIKRSDASGDALLPHHSHRIQNPQKFLAALGMTWRQRGLRECHLPPDHSASFQSFSSQFKADISRLICAKPIGPSSNARLCQAFKSNVAPCASRDRSRASNQTRSPTLYEIA